MAANLYVPVGEMRAAKDNSSGRPSRIRVCRARQHELGRVSHGGKVQPVGGRGGRIDLAIVRREHGRDTLRRRITMPDRHQQPGDIAHHVVQEGIGSDFQRHPFVATRHRQPVDTAHGRLCLAFDGAESAEVVFSHQYLRRGMHAFHVERAPLPGRAPDGQGGARVAIQDQVAVTARQRAVTCVEVFGDATHPGDAHILR